MTSASLTLLVHCRYCMNWQLDYPGWFGFLFPQEVTDIVFDHLMDCFGVPR